ncbi:TetR/AcrR family transcriptional regulator [Pseudogemmobacter humi]|uniref:HTH-type transcriptional regulator AcrR n=1 Tax=Pseudogemmobacter humi TaxID=2483812 RepID=A0A3P5XND3_9RHOB|nr:TetR/AcrR family transcriptional regulator [Pseudogemmobacter humi]VDC29319.1 HTH-type transcriptional regulator AcrR [Pseudogemmobacter humi]
MGRKPTITREKLLDLAEELVRSGGAAALTIGALAQAAGITKGGVQYSFASKEDLVRSLIDRWTSQFDALMGEPPPGDPVAFVRRYIQATRASQQAMNARMAGLLVGSLKDPVHMQEIRAWYQGMFSRLDGPSPRARAARVAFLAVEGLFLMRINGIDEEGAWFAFLDDVEAMLSAHTAGPCQEGGG